MKRISLILSLLVSVALFAQEPLFTQYYVNDMILNPAISGSKTYNPVTIQTKQQWLGFEGAPLSSNISYHGALDDRSAIGGYFMLDREYPFTRAQLQLNYAYHVPLDYDKINISFGLGAKVKYYNIDFDIEDLPPAPDEALSSRAYNKTVTDASSGVYLYGHNFYAGFSVSNMFQKSFKSAVQESPYANSEYRNYYGMGAYRFGIINNDWHLEPSFLIRKTEYQASIIDLTTRIFYLDNSWTGLTYRNNSTAVFLLGFVVNNLHISYSYDYSFSGELTQSTLGTHELGVTLRIPTLASQRHIGFWSY